MVTSSKHKQQYLTCISQKVGPFSPLKFSGKLDPRSNGNVNFSNLFPGFTLGIFNSNVATKFVQVNIGGKDIVSPRVKTLGRMSPVSPKLGLWPYSMQTPSHLHGHYV